MVKTLKQLLPNPIFMGIMHGLFHTYVYAQLHAELIGVVGKRMFVFYIMYRGHRNFPKVPSPQHSLGPSGLLCPIRRIAITASMHADLAFAASDELSRF
jgi:hypothetical protein